MSDRVDEIIEYEKWWNDGNNRDEKPLWTEAITDFFHFGNIKVEDVEFTTDLVIQMLPEIMRRDRRWIGFPTGHFDTKAYSTHRMLYQEVQRVVSNLKAQQADIRK